MPGVEVLNVLLARDEKFSARTADELRLHVASRLHFVGYPDGPWRAVCDTLREDAALQRNQLRSGLPERAPLIPSGSSAEATKIRIVSAVARLPRSRIPLKSQGIRARAAHHYLIRRAIRLLPFSARAASLSTRRNDIVRLASSQCI